MISDSMYYRIYRDSVAVLIDIRSNRLVMLQDRWFDFFKTCLCENTDVLVHKHPDRTARFMDLGILERHEKAPCDSGSTPYNSIDTDGDLSVFHYYAFRNALPVAAHFNLTTRCNLTCRHCYSVRSDDRVLTEDAFRIVDDLHENGVFFLVITGGEFFLRKDAIPILDHLRKRKFLVRIDTNGTLIHGSLLRNLEGFRNIRFHISLYSATPGPHDRITGVPGSHEKTLRAVHALTDAGFMVRLNCVVMKENIRDFQSVKRDIADRFKIPVRFNPHLYPMDNGSKANLSSQLSPEEILHVKQFSAGLDREQYLSGGVGGRFRYCKAGFSFFSINNGDVYPCPKMKGIYNRPLGNLLKQSFKHIWHSSPGFLSLRKQINENIDGCRLCSG